MKATQIKELKELAKDFLDFADKENEKISAFLDGSDSHEDADAYFIVKEYETEMTDLYNEIFNEHLKPCLNYDLAYEILEY